MTMDPILWLADLQDTSTILSNRKLIHSPNIKMSGLPTQTIATDNLLFIPPDNCFDFLLAASNLVTMVITLPINYKVVTCLSALSTSHYSI